MKNLKTLFAIAILSISCSKDNDEPQPQPEIPKVTTVYVGGTSYITENATKGTATIWVNGVAQYLTTTLGLTSVVNSVYVDGNENVFSVGYEGDFGNTKAIKWENGVKTTLSQVIGSSAKGVFVANGKTYIVGSVNNAAVIWYNNNTEVTLSVGTSLANSVCVNGNDIYIAGFSYNGGTHPQATLWKNNGSLTFPITFTPIKLNNNNSEAISVVANNNGVYTAGYEITSVQTSKLWKNNLSTQDYGNDTSMYSVFVQGLNIYTSGFTRISGVPKATIWKDNTPTILSQNQSIAASVFATDTDFFVAGSEVIGTSNTFNASFWKNGIKQVLSTNGGVAYSLFVTKK